LGGFVENVLLSPVRVLDYFSKQTRLLFINERSYVVKDYASEVGLLKWYLIVTSNLAVRIYPFKLNPVDRLNREVEFMYKADRCFQKPEIFLVDYKRLKLVREFVRGTIYSFNAPPGVHYLIGKNLGECHENGWFLGDTKASNFVVIGDKTYIVDAEQAVNEFNIRYAAWDLLVLISTLSMEGYLRALTNNYPRILDEVLRGYFEGGGRLLEVLKILKEGEFKLLSYILIPFPLNIVYAKKLEEAESLISG
jgi:tRNA A-37 threonylcarbamoyl transferase component Bud32